jgi:hypothetical protein
MFIVGRFVPTSNHFQTCRRHRTSNRSARRIRGHRNTGHQSRRSTSLSEGSDGKFNFFSRTIRLLDSAALVTRDRAQMSRTRCLVKKSNQSSSLSCSRPHGNSTSALSHFLCHDSSGDNILPAFPRSLPALVHRPLMVSLFVMNIAPDHLPGLQT